MNSLLFVVYIELQNGLVTCVQWRKKARRKQSGKKKTKPSIRQLYKIKQLKKLQAMDKHACTLL